MALEDILSALEDKAQSRIQEIRADAEQRVNEIKSEVEREAARTKRMRLKKVEGAIKSEATAMVYSAQLKGKNRLIRAQEEAVEEAFVVAEERMARIHESPGYPEIFAVLLDECLEYFDPSIEVVLEVRGDDRALAEKLMAERGRPYRISEEALVATGGLVASSSDGMVSVRNSFESRLARAKEHLKLEISAALFGA